MFLDPGGDGQHVGIENNILRRKADLLCQDAVGPLADFDFPFESIRLATVIESHYDHGRSIAADEFGLVFKLLLSFFEADGVDDAFALNAFQAGFDHRPFRTVYHDRHASDVRFRSDQIEEGGHRPLGIEHGLVHVDVDYLSAVYDLL